MYIPRHYQNLNNYLNTSHALIIYGSRQSGKTTLINHFIEKTTLKYKIDNGDFLNTQNLLSQTEISTLTEYLSGYELLIIDEAQKIPNIGTTLKIIIDHFQPFYVIATGSSSFELAGQIGEPLTGRKTTLILYPISILELSQTHNPYELKQLLPNLLVFGTYPKILTIQNNNEKIIHLTELTNSYLLKDILELQTIKSSKILLDLLRLIAFQIGNEVSLSELSSKLLIDIKTVQRYLDLLEKSFVLYNLRGYSKNLRSEVTKKSKYYFYDLGIRNSIISNFNPLELRNDTGQLWENFLVIERLKFQQYTNLYSNNYFWRTWNQNELDWIEERSGQIYGYEFKYNPKKQNNTKFLETYPDAHLQTINPDNFLQFIS